MGLDKATIGLVAGDDTVDEVRWAHSHWSAWGFPARPASIGDDRSLIGIAGKFFGIVSAIDDQVTIISTDQ